MTLFAHAINPKNHAAKELGDFHTCGKAVDILRTFVENSQQALMLPVTCTKKAQFTDCSASLRRSARLNEAATESGLGSVSLPMYPSVVLMLAWPASCCAT